MRTDLKIPFEHNGTTYTGVTLRRPKAKDMVRIADKVPALMRLAPKEGEEVDVTRFDGTVVDAMIEIVATLGDLPVEVAGELDFADLTELAPKAIGFLSGQDSSGAA